MLSRTCDGACDWPVTAYASAGDRRIAERSSAGDRSRRSPAVTLGKSQYIIPMPDGNQRRKNRQSKTPSQRCTKIAVRFTGALPDDRRREALANERLRPLAAVRGKAPDDVAVRVRTEINQVGRVEPFDLIVHALG